MRLVTKTILLPVFLVISGVALAQGMNGGAAEAKGASGTSNPSGERSTNMGSGSSGANTHSLATNSRSKTSHKKSAPGASAAGSTQSGGGN
jgi:nicotinic acid phosphoribosyltransferase